MGKWLFRFFLTFLLFSTNVTKAQIFSEDFESADSFSCHFTGNGSCLENCGCIENMGSPDNSDFEWTRGTSGSVPSNGTTYLYSLDDAGEDWVVYAQKATAIDLSTYCTVNLAFDYVCDFNSVSGANFRVQVYNGTSWITIQEFTTDQTTWTTYNEDIDVSNYSDKSAFKIRFRYSGDHLTSTSGNYVAIDDISLTSVSSVPTLSDLTIVTDGTCDGDDADFTIHFDVTNGSGEYEVYNTTSGSTLGSLTGAASNATDLNISGTIVDANSSTITVGVRDIGGCNVNSASTVNITVPQCYTFCGGAIFSEDFESTNVFTCLFTGNNCCSNDPLIECGNITNSSTSAGKTFDWTAGTDAGIPSNGTNYLYTEDDDGEDWVLYVSNNADLDLSAYCQVQVTFDYVVKVSDVSGANLRFELWDGNDDTKYTLESFTTDQTTWATHTETIDLSTYNGGNDIKFLFRFSHDNVTSTNSGNYAAFDNFCVTPLVSSPTIDNVSIVTDGTCDGDDANFTVSFDVSNGSGSYEVYNTTTSATLGTLSSAATSGTGLQITGTISNATSEVITVGVRDASVTCTANSSNTVNITIPECYVNTACGESLMFVDFEGGTNPFTCVFTGDNCCSNDPLIECGNITNSSTSAGKTFDWTAGTDAGIPSNGSNYLFTEDDAGEDWVLYVSNNADQDFSAYCQLQVTFDYVVKVSDASGANLRFELWDGNDDTKYTLETFSSDQTTWTSHTETIDLSSYNGGDDIKFLFRFSHDNLSSVNLRNGT
jgi:hypothetical protein